MFDQFLNSIFQPILNSVGTFWFIVIISFLVSLLTMIVYKFTTNQNLMKQLREDITKLNKEARVHMKNEKKALQIHNELMSKQMIMMRHSFSSTFITLLPLIVLFGWLSSNLTYTPLHEDTQFIVSINFEDYVGKAELIVPNGITVVDNATKEVSSKVDWRLSGKKGEYLLEWKIGDKSYTKDILITNEQRYSPEIKQINDGIVKNIQINYKKNIVLPFWPNWGWFGTYFLFSILFTTLVRKLLKIY